MQDFEIVIPVYWDAVDIVTWGIALIQKYLHPKRIVLIGPASMEPQLPGGANISFMDGNTVAEGMSKESIAAIMEQIAPGRNVQKRAGWYLQQMIKLGYAKTARQDAYLVWDADTVPTRELSFFDEVQKKSVFLSGGRHHHLVYYKSISRLFGREILPSREDTYVAHYMLIQKRIMLDMLDKIEQNTELPGKAWWEKIMFSIDADDIGESGFSEFETYGEFVNLYAQETYCMQNDIRKYTSSRIFLGSHPAENMIEWAGKEYDVLGFEARDPEKRFWKNLCSRLWTKTSYRRITGAYEIRQKLRIQFIREKARRGLQRLRRYLAGQK